jgi:hypothetical protein
MKWHEFDAGAEPLACVCCGEPGKGIVYCLGSVAAEDPPKDIAAFERTFNMEDALADFVVCPDCLAEYGGKSIDPMDWLKDYRKEDRKLISRKEALRILGSMKGTP